MKRTSIALTLILAATLADAQVVRTFVATTGSDSAPCSRTQPCRTFGTAIAAVDPGGEVVTLDSGGYGPFVVAKSVSIIAPAGIHAAIAPTTGTAISVQAGAGNDVTLRGLYLNSQGANVGIVFGSGDVLHVERCVVNGFSSVGISTPRSAADQDAEVFLSDSVVRGGAGTGVLFGSSDATSAIKAVIDNCRLESNDIGLEVGSVSQIMMARSVVSANGDDGVRVTASMSALFTDAVLTLDRCVLSNNRGNAVVTMATAGVSRAWIRGCTITNNGVGIREDAGIISTLANNTVTRNGTQVVGTLSTVPAF